VAARAFGEVTEWSKVHAC